MNTLIGRLIEHENYARYVYKDSLGLFTIGIGRCVNPGSGAGLTMDEQIYLLNNDIARCKQELLKCPFYSSQDDVRKDALIELNFALGLPRLLGFHKMLDALTKKNYVNASKELLNSKWATQVHERANDIAYRIEHGSYPAI